MGWVENLNNVDTAAWLDAALEKMGRGMTALAEGAGNAFAAVKNSVSDLGSSIKSGVASLIPSEGASPSIGGPSQGMALSPSSPAPVAAIQQDMAGRVADDPALGAKLATVKGFNLSAINLSDSGTGYGAAVAQAENGVVTGRNHQQFLETQQGAGMAMA